MPRPVSYTHLDVYKRQFPYRPKPSVLDVDPTTPASVPEVAATMPLIPAAALLSVVPTMAGPWPEVTVLVTCNTPEVFVPVIVVVLLTVCWPLKVLFAANWA